MKLFNYLGNYLIGFGGSTYMFLKSAVFKFLVERLYHCAYIWYVNSCCYNDQCSQVAKSFMFIEQYWILRLVLYNYGFRKKSQTSKCIFAIVIVKK